MKVLMVFLGFLAVTFAKDYTGYAVFKATPMRPAHLRWLKSLIDPKLQLNIDYWVPPMKEGKSVQMMLGPEHIRLVKNMMDEVKLPYEIITDDVNAMLVAEASFRNPATGIHPYGFPHRYLTYHEMMLWIDNNVATKCYDGIHCETIHIGNTHEGRDMKVMKITTGGVGKRKIWVDGGIHAREWIAPATAMNFIDHMLREYHNDADTKQIMQTYDFYFLPLINADGYAYTWTDERLWRKSRTLHPGNSCYGTDINRNFNHMYGSVGTSNDSCSNTYRGPHYESEIEAKHITDYMMARKGEWEVYLTLHSKGQLWMAPWGYTTDPPKDYQELMRVGQIAVDALKAKHNTDYTLGSASEILYASSGTSRDWAYGAMEIPYVFTIELRDTGFYGWELPEDQILPTGEETWAGFKAMLLAIINK